jgi:TM2 domain-containing membrane protein YozV
MEVSMYKIIGADGREYGPVGVDQVKQWIAEGRANAQTRAQAEGGADWRSLADLAEFHASLGISGNVPPPVSPPVQPHVTTRPPGADKKIVAGICGILLGCFGIHKFILGYTGEGLTMLLITVLTCGIGAAVTHIIGLIEGIIYLTKSDEEFVNTYVINKKGWF